VVVLDLKRFAKKSGEERHKTRPQKAQKTSLLLFVVRSPFCWAKPI